MNRLQTTLTISKLPFYLGLFISACSKHAFDNIDALRLKNFYSPDLQKNFTESKKRAINLQRDFLRSLFLLKINSSAFIFRVAFT